MSAELARDIWNEVRGLLTSTDRADAAEHIVSVLIEHDIVLDDIYSAFRGDTDFKNALRDHHEGHESEDEEYWDEEDFDEDY